MASRFGAVPLPWVMGVVFSAISVHSFLYNRAADPVPDARGAASAPPAAQGADPGRAGYPAGTAGADRTPPVLPDHADPGHQDRPRVIDAPAGTAVETAPAPAPLAGPETPELADLPLADAMADDADPVSGEQDPGSVDHAASVASVRPAVRPAPPGAAPAAPQETKLAPQVPSASPTISIRPMARPDARAVSAAQAAPAPQTDQTDRVAAAVSRALVLLPQPDPVAAPQPEVPPPVRAREPKGGRIGRILGVFETNARRWALIETLSGRITILEPGAKVGSGVVLSISNGALVIQDGETVRQYRTGDSL